MGYEQEYNGRSFGITFRRPKELTPLTAEAIVYLDTSREKYESLKAGNGCKGLLMDGLHLVMVQHFDLNYPMVDAADPQAVVKFLEHLYNHYDGWLKSQPDK